MVTLEQLQFELERGLKLLKSTTTMPDSSSLGYDGDPNIAGTTSAGRSLVYNAPIGTGFIQQDGTYWQKITDGPGGQWKKTIIQGGGDTYTPEAVASFDPFIYGGQVGFNSSGDQIFHSPITLNVGTYKVRGQLVTYTSTSGASYIHIGLANSSSTTSSISAAKGAANACCGPNGHATFEFICQVTDATTNHFGVDLKSLTHTGLVSYTIERIH